MPNEIETLKAELLALREALMQEQQITKAACTLADRYRNERDAARGVTAAAKSRLADSAMHGDDLKDAISKALAGSANVNTKEGHAVWSQIGKGTTRKAAASKAPLSGAITKVLRGGAPVRLGDGNGQL